MQKPAYQMSGDDLEVAVAAGAHPELILQLAQMATHGWRGVAQDDARVLMLEQHAASMGYPRAMRKLADRYNHGDGVEESQALAFTWWRNAANAGDVNSMSNLIEWVYSDDPALAAEGRYWLEMAARYNQPHAVHTLAQLRTGAPRMDLARFAQMSLEEIAASAPPSLGEPLEWNAGGIKGTLAQLNDLIGWWIERLRASWGDLGTYAEVDGDDIDFPCPDVSAIPDDLVDNSSGSLEVTLHRSNAYHVQLDASYDEDDGWSLSLSSFEPHPTRDEQAWLVHELVGVAAQIGIPIRG